MIYFLVNSFSKNSAYGNRLLGYLSAIDDIGVKVRVVIFQTASSGDHYIDGHYRNVTFTYYPIRQPKVTKCIRILSLYYYFLCFLLKLRKGDCIYTYGINLFTRILTIFPNISVVAEITEHPSILDGGRTTRLSAKQKFIVANKLSHLFVISTQLKKCFVENGCSSSKISIINMIVDEKRFLNITKSPLGDDYIAYCGNASNNKDGVDKLIRAFSYVCKKKERIKLYIIGKEPSDKIHDSNVKLAMDLGIAERIYFTGLVPSNQIPQLLVDASVLLLNRPDSVQAKCGFPTKLGEYLLSGNPVVVTNVGDISLFLRDGFSAMLSSPDDDMEFANKILWLLDHETNAKEIGNNGKQVALAYFNSVVETRKLIDVISTLV